ncbi:MAG: dienelactone hydrolase family protein [Cellvibrionaceae bacterium]|nr:dienelactone hydrolase family protein [Cellvibrionaceae bacterium]
MSRSILFTLLIVFVALGLNACQHHSTDDAADASYPVGSRTVFIHDPSRPFDRVGGVNTGVRTLIAEIWYPAANIAASRRARYGDYAFGDKAVHRRMMSETSFYHLTPKTVRSGVSQQQIDKAIEELFERQRGSYVDAPVAAAGPFPVVVMSHGDAGSRYNMQTVCEHLAAHGYIVIAPEHTGNSPFSQVGKNPALTNDKDYRRAMAEVLPRLDSHGVYAHELPMGQSYYPDGASLMSPEGLVKLDGALLERINDLRAALDYLQTINRSGPLAGTIDLQRIGLMGRSFGGITTLAALALEDRFSAGMSVVPPYIPDLRPLLPEAALKPAGTESVLLGAEREHSFARLHKPTLLLAAAEDQIIIDSNRALAQAMKLSPPSPEQPHPLLYQLFSQARVPAFWGLLANTDHGSLGVAAPYWWPDLKAKQKPRALNPEQRYTLMDSEAAHRLQKDKALAFFEVFVKGETAAGAQLKKGLAAELWEVRNF